MDIELLTEFSTAFDQATNELGLCPNRVWAVAGQDLPRILPKGRKAPPHENHEQCTFDFCEYSQRDFTAIEQRHECSDKSCGRVEDAFPPGDLIEAVKKGNSTVWSLDGKSILNFPSRFIAISHVWSDGTGAGAWKDGDVNSCLYAFFCEFAEQLQCDGIWWDTICIPRDKAIRAKAMNSIPQSYEKARATIVHDLYLRDWEWIDAESACFAILMSPWFSRGWTALELAKSRNVKIIFKGPRGPLLKDLDREILAKKADIKASTQHKAATAIIQKLRGEITTVNDLLTTLSARNTSWQRDIAVISGLLVGIDIEPHSEERGTWQQTIYSRILQKMKTISYGHLFHNSATMYRGFSWCPANLLAMPSCSDQATLSVEDNGDLTGIWKIFPFSTSLQDMCSWQTMHPLTQKEIQKALKDRGKCILLAEPGVVLPRRALMGTINHRTESSESLYVRYLGTLSINPTLLKIYIDGIPPKQQLVNQVRFLNRPEGATATAKKDPKPKGGSSTSSSNSYPHSDISVTYSDPSTVDKPEWTPLHDAIWTGNREKISELLTQCRYNTRDGLGQLPLHLAAERGDEITVKELLRACTNAEERAAAASARCHSSETPLHRAAWGGSATVVKWLLRAGNRKTMRLKDKYGNAAIHVAAKAGFQDVVKVLAKNTNSISQKGWMGLSPLHYAILNSRYEVVQLLVARSVSNSAADIVGWTPLHYAAWNGDLRVAKLLIQNEVNVNAGDYYAGWSPLHMAAMRGHGMMVELLRKKHARPNQGDALGFLPWEVALINQHSTLSKALKDGTEAAELKLLSEDRWSALHCIAWNNPSQHLQALLCQFDPLWTPQKVSLMGFLAQKGLHKVAESLLGNGLFIKRQSTDRPPLHYAAENGKLAVARLFISHGANVNEIFIYHGEALTPIHLAILGGHDTIVELLLQNGATVTGLIAPDAVKRLPLLSRAAAMGNGNIVKLILLHRSDVLPPLNLQQALCYASRYGHVEVVKMLLLSGAETFSGEGRTPLGLAAEKGHTLVVDILLQRGANPNAEDERKPGLNLRMSCNPVFWAVKGGNLDILRQLLDHGGHEISSSSMGRDSPLVNAVRDGHESIVRLLLERGPASRTKIVCDRALSCAASNRHWGIMEMLLEYGIE